MSSSRRFSLPLWPTVLVTAVLILTVNLGFWQLRREAEKQHLQDVQDMALSAAPIDLLAALASDNPAAHRVQVLGAWLEAPLLVLENQSHDEKRGAHLLQWLLLNDSRKLLVDRGWQIDSVAPPTVASGAAQLHGVLYKPGQPWRSPVLDLQQPLVRMPVLDFQLLRAGDDHTLPYLLRLDGDSAAALQPNWQTNGMTPAKHRGYAVTWFALSAALLLMYGWWLYQPKENSRKRSS
ncbi:SURF1 family protein [Permianibacter sp. IMCC34836]|uniref:SURF1 family protein n=1 Tax=Permianibacter fluminis TaxID=2738515 RepID=UPI001554DD65|nr:SURF1 family protein [Permianibacter fluminis]NQD36916.1 SURF1 family protein [Permianibacter fluminis]